MFVPRLHSWHTAQGAYASPGTPSTPANEALAAIATVRLALQSEVRAALALSRIDLSRVIVERRYVAWTDQ